MILKNVFKWNFKKFASATLGEILLCFGLNVFIVPMGLYTGGLLGISQLIRTLILNIFHLNVSFEIAGLINFLFNIPLFIIAYKNCMVCYYSNFIFINYSNSFYTNSK